MKPLIIDVREPAEYAGSHLPGAINVPAGAFMSQNLPVELTTADKDQPIVLYCRSGQRSNTCIQILKQLGFKNLTNGINEGQVSKLLSRL